MARRRLDQILCAFIFALATFSLAARASEKIEQRWSAQKNVELYEYQLSLSTEFNAGDLVDEGAVREAHASLELAAGQYLFRWRSVDGEGKASAWSTPQKILVTSAATRFRFPRAGERFSFVNGPAPLHFEWQAVEGASLYELTFKNASNGEALKLESRSSSLVLPTLAPGAWTASLQAKDRHGNRLTTAPTTVSFSITEAARLQPEILQPRADEIFQAHLPIAIVWRSAFLPSADPTARLELLNLVTGKIIWEKTLTAKMSRSVETPTLEPGHYQLSLREGGAAVASPVDFWVESDPQQIERTQLGWRWRLLGFGPRFSHQAFENAFTKGPVENKNPGLDLQSGWEIPLRLTLALNLEADFSLQKATGAGVEEKFRLQESQLRLGVAQELPFSSLHQDWRGLAFLTYRSLSQPVASRWSHWGVAALTLGLQYRLRGWHRFYEFEARTLLEQPVLAEAGPVFGHGAPHLLPRLEAEVALRRRLGPNWATRAALALAAERLSVSEAGQTVDTAQRDLGLAFHWGFEWLW